MTSRQNRQNTIPVSTRHDEQIQTDVNLIGNAIVTYQNQSMRPWGSSKFFEFCNRDDLLRPFSDYYLLNQFNDLLQKLKTQTAEMDSYHSKRLIQQLSNKVHGILIRELRLCGQKSDYYDLLSQKQKQITALQITNSYLRSHSETAFKDYEIRIAELEREIKNLNYLLTKYQSAEQENVIYRGYFKELQRIIIQNKSVEDIQALLNTQIIPKINSCEVQLSQLSRRLEKDRNNKMKGAIARHARDLDQLANQRSLDWAMLRDSAGAFFTDIEKIKNDDNWVNVRLDLSRKYQQLRTRHIAILSLIQNTTRDLKIENSSLSALREFQRVLRQQSQHQFKTVNIEGWIGLGTIHCHHYGSHSENIQKELANFKLLFSSFQAQIKGLMQKYPQLKQDIGGKLQQFLSFQIIGQLINGQSFGRIQQIVVHQPQIVSVQNVYQYCNSSDKTLIFNLRVLVKALLDELEKIRNQKGIPIHLDEGILGLLRQNILDGVNVEDILSLYRPPARICEVDRVILRPEYTTVVNHRGVPIKVQEGVPLDNKKHEPVILEREKPIKQQKNQFIYIQNPEPIPVRRQVPVLVQQPVPSPVYEIVLKQQTIEQINEKQRAITDYVKQIQIQREDIIAEKVRVIEKQIPYQVIKRQIVEVEKIVPEPVPQKIQYAKVIQVPTTIPVFVQKPTYEVVEKKIPYIVKRQEPVYIPFKEVLIESTEVPLCVDRLVTKTVKVIDHCDCQKPDAVTLTKQVPLIRQVPKQLVVQKAHFIKGDEIQKLVEVAIVKQVPLIQQRIKEVQFCVQKLFVQEIWDERLIVVEKEKPIEFIRYEPVELHIEKPVILKDQVIKEIKVEVPVPIIIEKQVVKVVQCKIQTIVEKIVQVPKVQIIEKIVQKIVPVPRIIEKIVCVPQIIEKCVVVSQPCLQIVEVERQVPVIQRKQQIIEVQCVKQVLRIEKEKQYVQIKGQPIETKRVIKEPVTVELIQEKIVQTLVQVERKVEVEVPVPLVHKFTQTVPVQVVKDKALYVDREVPIVEQVPIFYKQPEIIIQDNVVEVEKIVPVERKVLQIVEVEKPVCVYQQRVVQVPSEPIILKQKQLELVYVDKAPIVQEVEKVITQPHYIYTDKVVKVLEQQYVQPGKTVEYLEQPHEIQVQRIVPSCHYNENPVQFPTVRFSDVRTVLTVPQVQRFQKPILQVAYEQREPQVIKLQVQKPYERVVQYPVEVKEQVLAVNDVSNAVYIERQRVMEGPMQTIYQTKQYPEYIQKVVEKIIMLPQIVQVEKKVHLIEEVNKLITKEVDERVYSLQYKQRIQTLKMNVDGLLKRLRTSRNKADSDLLADMEAFYQLLISTDKMPKIIQIPKEVRVQVERDRPVLIPVYDHEQEIVLHTIISKLTQGISKFRKDQIQKNFDQDILNIFFHDLDRVKAHESLQKYLSVFLREGQMSEDKQRSQQIVDYVNSRWRAWSDGYNGQIPDYQPLRNLTESYKKYSEGYSSRRDDYAALKASFLKHHLQHYSKVQQSQKLNIFYIQLIKQLWDEAQDLKKRLATEQYNKDKISSDYTNLIRQLKNRFEKNNEKSISSTELSTIITSFPSYISSDDYGSYMSRAVLSGIGGSRISGFGSGIRGYGSRGYEVVEGVDRSREDHQVLLEKEKIISEIVLKNSDYEQQTFEYKRKVGQLQRENETLRDDLNKLRQFSTSAQNNSYEMKAQMRQ